VIWDSHPLALGATPAQVVIDGIPQIYSPYAVRKPDVFQQTPKVPNFDKEAEKVVAYEGLPPLEPKKAILDSTITFQNVKSIYQTRNGVIQQIFLAQSTELGTVVTRNGSILCYGGDPENCRSLLDVGNQHSAVIDLEGGSISPGFISYGSPLGLENINGEPSTNDGIIFDPLHQRIPRVLGGHTSMIQAVDGLQFGTRDALYVTYYISLRVFLTSFVRLAYRSGVISPF